jgi:hypothetical protein
MGRGGSDGLANDLELLPPLKDGKVKKYKPCFTTLNYINLLFGGMIAQIQAISYSSTYNEKREISNDLAGFCT